MGRRDMETNQAVQTFEAGARRMREAILGRPIEAYFANAEDPLHAAFLAKAIVHPGFGGRPLMGGEAARAFEDLAARKRSGKSLAYIHIPFCETRCLYCMFYQNPLKEEAAAAYARRLARELGEWARRAGPDQSPVHAVYFGGGTPTALSPEDIRIVLKAVRECLPIANDCEITFEGRIHNFTDEKMEAALEGGVNRFSLGVQTFNSGVRRSVMRVDGRDAIISRLERLCSYDNAAVVIDLIYGFPGQTMEIWEDDIRTAASLPLDGADCYQLNVFERSPLAKYIAAGKLPPAADQARKADMFARSVELFTNARWRRLSNSHWGQTNRERNIYNHYGKSACDCLAFGSGGGGRLFGHSFMRERNLAAWSAAVDGGGSTVPFLSPPGPNWNFLRTVASEMESGAVNVASLERRFGFPVGEIAGPVLSQWTEAGLLTRAGEFLVQTVAGQYWHVTLAQLLIELLSTRIASGEAVPA